MDHQYPEGVINKLLQITLQTQTFAYFSIDDSGALHSLGGDTRSVGLPAWSVADNVLDDALFLTGMLPLKNSYELIESFQQSDQAIFDVHLFRDQPLTWVVLVDKSEAMEWQSRARQKGNELSLLQQQIKQLTSTNQAPFFEALNMMALCRNEDNSFTLLKPVPTFFREIYPEAFNTPNQLYPHQEFPFIENFMIDAERHWQSGDLDLRVYSGPWVEHDKNNEDFVMEAMAANWNGQQLLFIEKLDHGYQEHLAFLQKGRESKLDNRVLQTEVHKQTAMIRKREEEIALRLICAVDTRDQGETGEHIRRLGLYSELMAQHLGWDVNRCDEIRIAAAMHDIGKIGIPDSILKKPAQLTPEEFEVMKTHTEIGAKILSNSKTSLVNMAQEIALNHHEKWDGSGYPRGLKGEEISIVARIVAIADVFDALTHKRVYKKAMPANEALASMRSGRGTHFDPSLFDLFVSLDEQIKAISRDQVSSICGDLNEQFTGS